MLRQRADAARGSHRLEDLEPEARQELLGEVAGQGSVIRVPPVDGVEVLVDSPRGVGEEEEREPRGLAGFPEAPRRVGRDAPAVARDGLELPPAGLVSGLPRELEGMVRVAATEVEVAFGHDPQRGQEVALPVRVGLRGREPAEPGVDALDQSREPDREHGAVVEGRVVARGGEHGFAEEQLDVRRHGPGAPERAAAEDGWNDL